MGSQAIQAVLWGRSAGDWAAFQESTGQSNFDYALQQLHLAAGDNLLDVGCGSGLFCSLAAATGATVTGFDATEPLLDEARKRSPKLTFIAGDMEALPFPDASFDIVTGFNSFQYAASVANALAEAKRVLKPGGRLVAMIWGDKKDCEAASYLATIGSLLPPPPPGAPGPFALSEGQRLRELLTEAGFHVTGSADIPSIWDYPDTETALKGLLSAGPATRAIDHSGFDKVNTTLREAVKPYIKSNGHVVYHNAFRVVTANK
jgi:SAM-dependent methyltransferase